MDELPLTGWWLVKQPNDLFLRFCHDTNTITHYQMTNTEALDVCIQYSSNRGNAQIKFDACCMDYDRRGHAGRWQYVLGKVDKRKFNALNKLVQANN